MSMLARTVAFCIFGSVALFIATTPRPAAAATDVVCSPFVPHTRVVGNKAVDTSCDDDSIQSAIDNTVCPNTTIYLTAEHSFTGQHVTIQNKSLTIFGSTATSCSGGGIGAAGAQTAAPTAPVTTIAGDGSQSVFDISGTSNVTFQYVEITGGGGGADSHGGGINFVGAGSLTIDTSTIDSNHANFGGGIEMNGSGGSATLTLNAYSVIESNTASGNGGGINIEGNAQLVAVQPFTWIALNHAPNGKGGGIAVVGLAQANIGSGGYVDLPVIDGNDAAFGGGISLEALNDGDAAYAFLFTTDATHPVRLSGNFASQAGGAVYAKPMSGLVSTGAAQLCAWDFRMDGNGAPEGAALYGDVDTSITGDAAAYVGLNKSSAACATTFVSTPCAAGVACNVFDGNASVDTANQATPGAVIFAYESNLDLDRFVLRSNTAEHGLRLVDASAKIDTCLIADNAFAAESVELETDGNIGSTNLFNCTIANNAHNSGSVIRTANNLTLRYDILDQPAMSSVATIGTPAIFADDVLAADPTGLPVQPNIVQGEPVFVDATNANVSSRNYRQVAYVRAGQITASPGMDFAPPVAGDDRDLDGNPNDQDVAQVPNLFGDRDLGCYEAQPIVDRVFADALGDPVTLVLP